MLRELNYTCGCKVSDKGINLCDLHFAIFNFNVEEIKKELSQERYNQIIHALNSEEQERKELYSSIPRNTKDVAYP